ncbi:hypothetical protein [Hansschlegelia zhihuaiae]|uniref:Uncharacterized protein n=1 Tax=Hansschlegelia zhihuaiae TaxID=405005 RepID=A0A4Q0MHR4_9HYPH|nr:hypothetical protein [Hansschlegelia zhihuaiae]RXF73127.1 hypothetical protein EK403_11605 [Hansschlegelia zhihuaiae]
MLARLAARLLLAPFGLACGVVAALAMLVMMSAEHAEAIRWLPEDVVLLGYDLSINAATIALLFAPLMGAPAIVAVLIAEMFSIRSWIYHAAAGAGSALMPWALAPTSFEGPVFSAPQVVAAGIVGGLVHWLVAGRRSGVTDPEPPHP